MCEGRGARGGTGKEEGGSDEATNGGVRSECVRMKEVVQDKLPVGEAEQKPLQDAQRNVEAALHCAYLHVTCVEIEAQIVLFCFLPSSHEGGHQMQGSNARACARVKMGSLLRCEELITAFLQNS